MKWLVLVAALGVLVPAGFWFYFDQIANPKVIRELTENPAGKRAGRVMLLTLPSGRQVPVNYWRDGDRVYAAADGRWWRELEGDGFPVTVLVRGETLSGVGRAVRDDPAYTKRIFESLRPDAIEGFGTLVEVVLTATDGPAGS